MRRSRFVLFSTAILISACTSKMTLTETESAMGEVSISLESRNGHQIVVPMSKSTVDAPEADLFEVEIFNSNKVRLYRDTYANTVGQTIKLNAGEYRLLAHYGDSLGVGFDAIYFEADENFTVVGQTNTPVQAVAKMANVKAAVNFGANFKTYYPDHYALLKHPELKNSLRFNADETRAGYIPAGELTLEVYADVDGTWKYYKVPAAAYAANEFVTFNVDVDPRQGSLSVSITIDDSVNTVNKDITVTADARPVPGPEISLTGFTDNTFNFIEGMEYAAQSDFVVRAGIAECTLSINSDYLVGQGLPSTVELVSADEDVRAKFEAVGITWNEGMDGSRIGSVDFSGMSKMLTYDASSPFSATFSLTVKDKKGKTENTGTCTIKQIPAEISLTAAEGNAFAKRIEGLTANITAGNPDLLELQYSTDGNNWTTATKASVSGTSMTFNTISNLTPSTAYNLRLIYNNNEDNVYTASLTTEAAAQIDNNGFENWSSEVYSFKALTSKSLTWYQPWGDANNKWWAVNSRQGFHSSALTTSNQNVRAFYSVVWSNDVPSGSSGSRSAHIFTVNAGTNTTTSVTYDSDTVVGELFIGTSDDSGNHSSDGHSFSSRPSAMSFKYKYVPRSGETFYAKIEIQAADGTVIATKEITDGAASSAWADFRMPLEYSDISKKAAKIYVSFKSTSTASSSAAFSKNSTLECAGSNAEAHLGSSLRIDDVTLEY